MYGKLRNMTSIYLYDNEDRMLMLYRIGSKAIKDSYIGTAGGHFEEYELNDAQKCVLRELNEEVGLTQDDIENLELKYVTIRYKKDEIRQNYYFFAKLKKPDKEIKSNEGNLRWCNFDEIKTLEMPHTAKYMIRHYIDIGRYTNDIYGGVAIPGGVEFTKLESFE